MAHHRQIPAARFRAATERDTVFIVDDDRDTRRAISLLVRSVNLGAAEYPSAQAFLNAYEPHVTGCLVLDVRLPGITGLQAQQQLADSASELPIIFVTAYAEVPIATAAMRAGAVDFFSKPFSPHELLDRIQEALAIGRENHLRRLRQQELDAHVSALTGRERQVMHLLAEGNSTKFIASLLGISVKTVDNHRARILQKMDVDNAAQLANLVLGVARRPSGPHSHMRVQRASSGHAM